MADGRFGGLALSLAVAGVLAEALFWALVLIYGKKVVMKFSIDRSVVLAVVAGVVGALIAFAFIMRWIGPLQMSL